MLCNSCNTDFIEETARNAHYRSDWHRYNLKRKVAGLPGVTEEWFESRRAAAAAAASALTGGDGQGKKASAPKLECSVCCKQYGTAKAFENHLKSRGHVAKAAEAPAGTATSAPVLRERKAAAENGGGESGEEGREGVKKGLKRGEKGMAAVVEGEEDEEEEEEGEGVWEEVEDEEEAAALMEEAEGEQALAEDTTKESEGEEEEEEEVYEWDCAKCLFCDKPPERSVEECVSHMHKAHGFFLPDAEYISDLSGLLSYLSLKITKGRMCLYCDERGRSFPTAEAVRAHMDVKCHAKLRYGDGSGVAEEELEEFYDFSVSYAGEDEGMQLALSKDDAAAAASHLSLQRGGMELAIRSQSNGDTTVRFVGSREFARYYKQRLRPSDNTQRLVSAVVARYKAMGLMTSGLTSYVNHKELAKRDTAVKASQRAEKFRTKVGLSNNIIRNLPKNVPY